MEKDTPAGEGLAYFSSWGNEHVAKVARVMAAVPNLFGTRDQFTPLPAPPAVWPSSQQAMDRYQSAAQAIGTPGLWNREQTKLIYSSGSQYLL